MPNWVRDSND